MLGPGQQAPTSAEVGRAPHADSVRAPPSARSSTGNPSWTQEGAWKPGTKAQMEGRRRAQHSGRAKGGGEAREEGVGRGKGGRGGGRIDSLSSTGTTELSCHGERGAAGRARGGRRSHMPEGRRQHSQSPLSHSLPQTRSVGPKRAGSGAQWADNSSLTPGWGWGNP